MAKPKIDSELLELSDADYSAKKAFVYQYIETLCDEVQACRLSDTNPLTLDYWKTNDEGFVSTLKTLKAKINGSIGQATKCINELADTIRQTLKTAGIYTQLLEPQISTYASIQYDLDVLAKRRASLFYDPLAGNSINPLEKLTKERRSELQTCLKALGLSAPSKGLLNTAANPDNDPLSLIR